MTLVVLVILWIVRGELNPQTQNIHAQILPMPGGTTVAQCEAEHQPALAKPDSEAILLGYKCVDITMIQDSGA